MAYRTGTYVAFDGLGQKDPTKSDYRYYATLQAWSANKNIDFNLVNSHEKTDAVRDTSKLATLKARIQERLRASKNMVVVLTTDTRKSGSMLSYEIEQAVDVYKIPLIIAYPDFRVIQHVNLLSDYWPYALSTRIGNANGSMIHIPFRKEPVVDAIGQFTVNTNKITGPNNYYSADAHRSFGLLNSWEQAQNIRS